MKKELACLAIGTALASFACTTITDPEPAPPTGAGSGGSASGTGSTTGNPDDNPSSGGGTGTESGGASGMGAGGNTTVGTGGGTSTTQVPADYPRGMSPGCGKAPPEGHVPGGDAYEFYMDTTADAGWLAEFNEDASEYANRVYRVKIPPNYDPSTPYTVNIIGGGCGGNQDGGFGGLKAWPDGAESTVIHVHPAYKDGCYLDDGINNPEVVFMQKWWPEFINNYCVDLERVFISGWSSGSWEAVSMGCAFAGTIRGHGSAAGGLRERRAECTGPVAGIIGGDILDGANPIHDTLSDSSCTGTEAEGCWMGKQICTGTYATRNDFPNTDPKSCVDEGTATVRDKLLERNGCVGTETVPWGGTIDDVPVEEGGIYRYPTFMHTNPGETVPQGDLDTASAFFPVPADGINNMPACHKYVGCPAEFPVVWCMTYDDNHSPLSRITENDAPDDGRTGLERFFEEDVPRYQ